MNKWIAALAAVACVAGFETRAQAAWPTDKPITIVVGYTAGAGVDLVTRLIADAMSKKLGTPIVVDNRPGAAGTIAQNYVAKAKPDGYTFIEATPSSSANASMIYSGLPYDPLKDFSFVGRTNSDALVLVAGPRTQAKDLKEFAAQAKANPGKVQFGNPGYGTYGHMTELKLQDLWDVQFNLVTYKGAPQEITDLLDKQIDAVIDVLGSYYPHVKAGELRVLGVFGDKRAPQLPNTPTAIEQGTNFSVAAFFGMEAPAGTPPDIIKKMNAALNDVLDHDEGVRSKLAGLGITPSSSTPEEYGAQIKGEAAKWKPVIEKYHIKAD